MTKIDVALIGAGRMGSVHGANAGQNPKLRLKYIVEPRAEAAAPLCAAFGAENAALERALADPEIAGVIVCSATAQHLDHINAALGAGKAVFSEKPIDLNLERVRAAAPVLDGAAFLLGFNRRFDPHVLALKQKLESGALGALESLHVVNHDPAAPPPGFIPTSGGLFKDFTIHDLDLARWLLDEPVVEVFAAASCLVDPEIGRLGDVDTARTVLRTESGRLCVISNTRRSGYGYDQRIEAFASKGMAAVGNVTADTVETFTEAGGQTAPIKDHFTTRYAASYRAEMEHFADMLHTGLAPRVSYADGLAALVLAEACAQSAASGAAVRL